MSWANPGLSGLILIVIVLVLVFGPSKLPEIGKAFGKSLKEFKDATRGMMDDTTQNAQTKRDTSANVQSAAAVEPIELKSEKDAHQ